jgi:hypothetical protein
MLLAAFDERVCVHVILDRVHLSLTDVRLAQATLAIGDRLTGSHRVVQALHDSLVFAASAAAGTTAAAPSGAADRASVVCAAIELLAVPSCAHMAAASASVACAPPGCAAARTGLGFAARTRIRAPRCRVRATALATGRTAAGT